MRIAGLDLSLRGLGAVVVPSSWDLDFKRVERASFGLTFDKKATEREITDRLILLSQDLTVWLERQKATHAYVESLPTQAFNIAPLAELRGVVRVALRRKLAVDIAIANQSSARKLLIGKLPKGADRKKMVVESLRLQAADFDDADQADAFTAANWGMRELGVPHLQELLFKFDAPKVKKPRARKAAAA